MKQLLVTLTGLLLVSLLATGCNIIRLTDYWMDPDFKGQSFSKYLVISLAGKTSKRIILEDSFVRELKKRDVHAVASYKILPPDGTVNKDVIREAIEGKGFDAVIVGRLVGIDVERNIILPEAPVGAGLYHSSHYDWYQPGRDYDVYKIQTTVWQVSTEKMIWKCQYDVVDPKNIPRRGEEVAKEIVKQLAKVKLL